MALLDLVVEHLDPEQLRLLDLTDNRANRLFIATSLLQDPLSPLWAGRTQKELVRLAIIDAVKTLHPDISARDLDDMLRGSRPYPRGTGDLVRSRPGIGELASKLGVALTEEAPILPLEKLPGSPLDLQFTRALIHRGLTEIPPSLVQEQVKKLDIEYLGYPTEPAENGLALWIIEHGVSGLSSSIRDVAIREIKHSAIVQLLRDQRGEVAAANGINIEQPEQMYREMMKIGAPIILPRGTYDLVSTIPGVVDYIRRQPEIGDIFPPLRGRGIIDRTVDYIIQNYGLDPQRDEEIKRSLLSLSNGRIDNYVLRDLASIVSRIHLRDPVTYLALSYANGIDALEAYRDRLALSKAIYPEGLSNTLTAIVGREVKVKELPISPYTDSEIGTKATRLFTHSQMIVTVSDLLTPILGSVDVDSIDTDKLTVLFVVLLSLDKSRERYGRYIDLLF
jgi:hypothetical protein